MTRHSTSPTSGQVDAAFVRVVFAGMSAAVGNTRPLTHRVSAGSLEIAIRQVKSQTVLGSTFGLARLQQKTRSRKLGKVESAF